MSKKADLFFEIFSGEYVEILQDFEITTTMNMSEHGEAHEIRMPMTVSGVLMDTDGEFLFLSSDGEQVNQALPIHTIKHIGIVPMKDQMQEVLDDVEPDPGSQFN